MLSVMVLFRFAYFVVPHLPARWCECTRWSSSSSSSNESAGRAERTQNEEPSRSTEAKAAVWEHKISLAMSISANLFSNCMQPCSATRNLNTARPDRVFEIKERRHFCKCDAFKMANHAGNSFFKCCWVMLEMNRSVERSSGALPE